MTKITLKEYRDMSNEVWQMFKKCYPEDGSADEFVKSASEIGNKYKTDADKYGFVVGMMRLYMQELNKIKGVQHGGNAKT